MNTVTIVGVGLIGGSFALALRKYGFAGRIVGVSSPRTLDAALSKEVIDEGLPLEKAVPQSDLIYLAQPIGRILHILPSIAHLAKAFSLVTDAGSTKEVIVSSAESLFRGSQAVFLGGHPMAGKAERGVESAEADLFRGATYVLTPANGRLPTGDAVDEFYVWLERIGARLVVTDPQEHDRLVALTSHLPQMASTVLASLLLEEMDSPDSWKVAGGGLRDMTRLARSAYDLWRDICMTNTRNIEQALSWYIQKLEHLRENLRERPLAEEFERGARFAKELQNKNPNVT